MRFHALSYPQSYRLKLKVRGSNSRNATDVVFLIHRTLVVKSLPNLLLTLYIIH
jgi:hypothetical protein